MALFDDEQAAFAQMQADITALETELQTHVVNQTSHSHTDEDVFFAAYTAKRLVETDLPAMYARLTAAL